MNTNQSIKPKIPWGHTNPGMKRAVKAAEAMPVPKLDLATNIISRPVETEKSILKPEPIDAEKLETATKIPVAVAELPALIVPEAKKRTSAIIEDIASETREVNGVRFTRYISKKQGLLPKLVIIPDAFLGAAAYKNLCVELCSKDNNGHECFVVHQRFEQSSRDGSRRSMIGMKDLIDDVKTVLDHIDREAVLIGHGRGGILAAHLRKKCPDHIKNIICLGVPARIPFRLTWQWTAKSINPAINAVLAFPIMRPTGYWKALKYFLPSLVMLLQGKKTISLCENDARTILFNQVTRNDEERERNEKAIKSLQPDSILCLIQFMTGWYSMETVDCPSLALRANKDKLATFQFGSIARLIGCKEPRTINGSHAGFLCSPTGIKEAATYIDRFVEENNPVC